MTARQDRPSDADVIRQFSAAMHARGLVLRREIVADGKIHRCDVAAAGSRGKTDGAYVLHLDGWPAGGFQNHRDGEGWENWRADLGRQPTVAEAAAERAKMDLVRRQRDADDARRHAKAERIAEAIWNASVAADGHAYLKRKQVPALGVRVINAENARALGTFLELEGDLLLVPMHSIDGTRRGLQFIDSEGKKRTQYGATSKGCQFLLGEIGPIVAIAEGYATACSIHLATQLPVVIAFGSGNLGRVGSELRKRLPDASLLFCADNEKSGDGLRAARSAAMQVGGIVAVSGDVKDFNDVHERNGLPMVKAMIERALETPAAQPVEGVRLLRADEIQPENVNWVWQGWLARRKLHLIAGASGTGKTTIALALAARITAGGLFPDGTRASPGSVVMWSSEDDIADTLVPRFQANGGDRSRLHFVIGLTEGGKQRPFNPATDMDALAAQVRKIPDVSLIVIDPMVTVVQGDSHKNSEVRRGLQPAIDLAAEANAVLIGITHFSKNTQNRDPLERICGSIAFGAVPRVVLGTIRHRDDSRPRRLVRVKVSNGKDGDGFEYTLRQEPLPNDPGICGQMVVWGDFLQGTARDLLDELEAIGGDATGAPVQAAAEAWLLQALANGPVATSDLMAAAEAEGISKITLRRAKDRLAVKVGKSSGKNAPWVWELPKMLKDAHANGMSTFDHLPRPKAAGDDREVF